LNTGKRKKLFWPRPLEIATGKGKGPIDLASWDEKKNGGSWAPIKERDAAFDEHPGEPLTVNGLPRKISFAGNYRVKIGLCSSPSPLKEKRTPLLREWVL